MDLGVRPEGHITIEVDGQTVREFDNLVLNSGWDALLIRAGGSADEEMVPKFLRFGTSDEEPSREQTGLLQPYGPVKAHTSMSHGGLVDAGTLTAYSQVIVRFDFDPGELSGARLTELSIGYGADGSEAYNRASIMDESKVLTPLVVLPEQSCTVYVRLRLFFMGWGTPIQVNQISGTLQMDGNIGSPTNGVWRKGLPFSSAEMQGYTSLREGYVPGNKWAKFYIPVPQWVTFATTIVNFRGRTNVTLVSINFAFAIVKPPDVSLHFRVVISVERAE